MKPGWARAQSATGARHGQTTLTSAVDEASEDETLILALWVGRYILSDGFIAYRSGDNVFVPLGEMMRTLEFPIEVQPALGRAAGWFLDEDREFILDLDRREARIDGRRQTVDRTQIQIRTDDIYVHTNLFETWFPVDLAIDFGQLLIEVTSREPLPFERRIAREEARARLRPDRPSVELPREDIPYRFVDWPFMDVSITSVTRTRTGRAPYPDGRLAVRASSDLFGMSSGLSIYSEQRDTLMTVILRGHVERRDPDGRLLGSLRARSIVAGDIGSPQVALISRGGWGQGVEVSNHPLTQALEFDRVTLRGTLLPGWDAELYRGPALLEFQTIGGDGRYEFEDVPLLFGENELRIVFYGPQGQRREVVKRYEVGRELLRPGEQRYRFVVTEAGQSLFEINETRPRYYYDEGMRASVELAQGLHRNVSLATAWAQIPARDGRHDYANLGLLATALGTFMRADASMQDGGEGYAFRLAAQTRRFGVNASAEHTHLSRFVSQEFDIVSDPLISQTRLRLDGAIPRSWLPRIMLGVSGEHARHESMHSRSDVSARIGMSWRRTALSNRWRWFAAKSADGALYSDYTEGETAISTRFSAVSLRSNVSYEVNPHYRLRTVDVRGNWRLGRRLRGYAGAVLDVEIAETAYLGGLTWDTDRVLVGLGGRYIARDDFDVQASLAFSVAREPRAGQWTIQSDPLADSGALSARVFVDANQNGVMDDGERPVEGARLRRVGQGRGDATDSNGVLFSRGLSSYDPVGVEIETGSLEDPFWVPSTEGLEIVPRPGRAAVIDFGLVTTGEIDGTVFLDVDGLLKEVSNVEVELIDRDGTVVQSTRTAFDGFYLFTMVRPGEYAVRVSPAQMERLRLTVPAPEVVVIEASGNVVSGVNFTVARANETETGTGGEGGNREGIAGGGGETQPLGEAPVMRLDDGRGPGEDGVSRRAAPEILDLSDMTRYVGFHFIHMSSYQSVVNAQRGASFVNAMGYESKIVFVDLGDRGQWYRVYAGPFATRTDAEQLLADIEGDVRFPTPRLLSIEE